MYVCIWIQNGYSFVITVSKGVEHFKWHQVINILILYQRTGPTGPILRVGLLLSPIYFNHKKGHTSPRCQLPLTTTEYNRNSKHAKYSRTGLCNTTYTVDLVLPASPVGSCISSWGRDMTQAHTTCPSPLPFPFPPCSFHCGKQPHSIHTARKSYYYLIHNLQVISTFDSLGFFQSDKLKA